MDGPLFSPLGGAMSGSSPAQKPALPEGVPWPEITVQWWDSLGSGEIAASWTAEDWYYLLDTALIHAYVWGNGDMTQLPELRARLEAMGITPAARYKQRMDVRRTDRRETPLDRLRDKQTSRRRTNPTNKAGA